MPTTQLNTDIGELRKTLVQVKRAEKFYDQSNPDDNIGKFCEEMRIELEMKIKLFEDRYKELEEKYKDCAKFYCEDPTKASSEFGGKMYRSLVFLSNN